MLDTPPNDRRSLVSQFVRSWGIVAFVCLMTLVGRVDASLIVQPTDDLPVGNQAVSADVCQNNVSAVLVSLNEGTRIEPLFNLMSWADGGLTTEASIGVGRSLDSYDRKTESTPTGKVRDVKRDPPNPAVLGDSPIDSPLRFLSDLAFVELISRVTTDGNPTQAGGPSSSHGGERLVVVGFVVPADAFPTQVLLSWLRARSFLPRLPAHPSELLRPPQVVATV